MHGVVCESCTKTSQGCSLAAMQPPTGPNWLYDQRRWILVEWTLAATADSAHPSEFTTGSVADVVPAEWFMERLRSVRSSADSGKRRGRRNPGEVFSNVKVVQASASKGPASLAKRKRSASTTTPSGPLAASEDEDSDVSVEEVGSDQERTIQTTSRRPVKRVRTEPRGDGYVPHAMGASFVSSYNAH